MSYVLVLLALVVTAGGVVAVGAASPRLAALGAIVALVGSAFVVDPLPSPLAIGARMAGSALAGYLVWIALRRAPAHIPGIAVAWPGAAAVAGAAFVIGWLAAGSLGTALAAGTGDGPGLGGVGTALAEGSIVARAAFGAALALAAASAAPVVMARDLLRLGLGLLLMLAASALLRNALGVSGAPVFELGMALLTALAGASVAAVLATALRRTGDLVLRDVLRRDAAVRHRPADDAHLTSDAGQ